MKFSTILSASVIAVAALGSQEAQALNLKGSAVAHSNVENHSHNHHHHNNPTPDSDNSWALRTTKWLRDQAEAAARKEKKEKEHAEPPAEKASPDDSSDSGSGAGISDEAGKPSLPTAHHLHSKHEHKHKHHAKEDFTLSSSSGSGDSDDEEVGFSLHDHHRHGAKHPHNNQPSGANLHVDALEEEAPAKKGSVEKAHALWNAMRDSALNLHEKASAEHDASQSSSGSGDSADDEDVQYPAKPTRAPKSEGEGDDNEGGSDPKVKPHLPKSPNHPSEDNNEQTNFAKNHETSAKLTNISFAKAPFGTVAAIAGAIAGVIGVVVAAVGLSRARRSDARYQASELIADLPDPDADEDEEAPRAPEALVDAPASTTNALEEAEGSSAPLTMQSPFEREDEAGEFTNA